MYNVINVHYVIVHLAQNALGCILCPLTAFNVIHIVSNAFGTLSKKSYGITWEFFPTQGAGDWDLLNSQNY